MGFAGVQLEVGSKGVAIGFFLSDTKSSHDATLIPNPSCPLKQHLLARKTAPNGLLALTGLGRFSRSREKGA
jgi:hypothetical protein